MRILELFGSGTIGTDDMGPVSTCVCELSNQLVALKHEVTVVDAKTLKQRKYLAEDIQLIQVDSYPEAPLRSQSVERISAFMRGWWNAYRYVHGVASSILLDDFDVIHAHAGTIAFILQRLYKRACVFTVHTPQGWCTGRGEEVQPRYWQPRWRVSKSVEISAIRNSILTIAYGENLRRCVRDANIEVIPGGLDFERYCPIARPLARQRLGFSTSDFILVCAARFDPSKGIDVLLAAVRHMMPAIDNLRVVIIGGAGSYNIRESITPHAQKLLDEAKGLPVDFTGFVENRSAEFRYYLAMADVVVVPSRADNQPRVMLEALAMGTPVIGSDTGAIPEMITSDVGCVFPPGDSLELAMRIRDLHDDRQKLARLKENCRAYIEKNYLWQEIASRHIDAFNRCGGAGE